MRNGNERKRPRKMPSYLRRCRWSRNFKMTSWSSSRSRMNSLKNERMHWRESLKTSSMH